MKRDIAGSSGELLPKLLHTSSSYSVGSCSRRSALIFSSTLSPSKFKKAGCSRMSDRKHSNLRIMSSVVAELSTSYKQLGKVQCMNVLRKTVKPRSPQEIEKLKGLAKMLGIIKDVNDSDLQLRVCESMSLTSLPANCLIYVQGQRATSYFVLLEGGVSVFSTHFRVKQKQLLDIYGDLSQETLRKPLQPGTNLSLFGQKTAIVPIEKGFGEVPRGQAEWSTTAITTHRSDVLEIPIGLYQRCLQIRNSPHLGMEDGVNFLRSVPLFASASIITLSDITYRLRFRRFQRGEVVAKEGDSINMILLVYSGEASVKQKFTVSSTDLYYHTKGHTVEYEICKSIAGAMLGALDVLEGRAVHSYTVHASTALDILEMTIPELQQYVEKYPNATSKFRCQEKERLQARQPPKLDNYVQNIVTAETMKLGKKDSQKRKTDRRTLSLSHLEANITNTQSLNSMFSTHLRTMSTKPQIRKPKHQLYIPGKQPAAPSQELPTLLVCTSDLNPSKSAPVTLENPRARSPLSQKQFRPEFFDLRPTKNLTVNLEYITGSPNPKSLFAQGKEERQASTSKYGEEKKGGLSFSDNAKQSIPSPSIPLRSGAKYSVIL